ncbi:zf-HC2 domain-containing protein [Syntrophaceticus schinkii]|jgi:predicted anti-sigma-YlaC factor YlaD|uniref:Anti-sigma-W factor RsiW n=1 Tax=Syntrophaceticus schinkii TaxID=499207 RepID=A0A0B7MBG8_9FIRM|nr:zf-HC2 domain-containing protein [Syntrophaceticus schinkii]MDD2360518.1 zf-HC2 domain-containing protein [Syntrophaceticus schinkii]MDD4262473.1 zf-HC2 domain-containing protein [Syntrophaceticus schinkii]MDD4675845.1 zf-HC2 domain-containing protein [Syntrophaceticus schinkii]CEO87844.1 membrane hypothetical protein [Syntrophaceticus schinkii]
MTKRCTDKDKIQYAILTQRCMNTDKIPDYLDGELKGEAEVLFKQHLKDCPQCRQELKKWEAMFSILELPQQDPGPGFANSVLEAINHQQTEAINLQPAGIRSPWKLKNLALLLAGVFLLAFSLSCWLLAGAGQLPLIHAVGQSCRIILETALGLLPAPLAAVIYQVESSLGGFLVALLSAVQQKLLFLFSLGEAFFVIIRALSPVTWAVMLATGFVSSLLLGRMLGNGHHFI